MSKVIDKTEQDTVMRSNRALVVWAFAIFAVGFLSGIAYTQYF